MTTLHLSSSIAGCSQGVIYSTGLYLCLQRICWVFLPALMLHEPMVMHWFLLSYVTDGADPGNGECLGSNSFIMGFRGQWPHVHILGSLDLGGTSPVLAKKRHMRLTCSLLWPLNLYFPSARKLADWQTQWSTPRLWCKLLSFSQCR